MLIPCYIQKHRNILRINHIKSVYIPPFYLTEPKVQWYILFSYTCGRTPISMSVQVHV